MKTRQRILTTALEIYNTQGIKISTRQIAETIGISAGNLHYHFQHTEDILKELFDELKLKMDEQIAHFGKLEKIGNQQINDYINLSFDIVWEYRFVFHNFIDIMRTVPEIKEIYTKLLKIRHFQLEQIFSNLSASGYFRQDLPAHCWLGLAEQTMILCDSWLSYTEVLRTMDKTEASQAFSSFLKASFIPYLSTKELAGYQLNI
ncbi:TetR/AcrR family transcriptional regulator [Nubsella zeaxanthinifaciens]|uniref:TetR/AcrR family transcriptional regulator n=1 Tax=Nubsella zeaxanthinifaciens TaxID=392412 RepID=UPI003CFFD39D